MLAPAFLLGLLAIGLPLWLHRMARAHPTRTPFPSLMFLEPSESQRSAQHTLRYWLLLVLRLLLIAALAFAFAQPLLPAQRGVSERVGGRLHVVMIDASFSMRYGDRWRRAIDAANSALSAASRADQVMLVRAAGQRIDVVHDAVAAAQAGAVRALLQTLEPGYARLDYGAAMSAAEQWREDPSQPMTLHFITDLQHSSAPLRFADLEPPTNTRLTLHAVDAAPSANTFIAAAAFPPGDRSSLQVTLRHGGSRSEQRQLHLLIDGTHHGTRSVELPAAGAPPAPALTLGEGGGVLYDEHRALAAGAAAANTPLSSATAAFSDLALPPGAHRLEFVLEPQDALPADDRYFAVIERSDPKVLLVANSERADDAAYFAAALGSLQSPKLLLEQRSGAQLDPAALQHSALAVITDVSALSSGAAQSLVDYVAAGGAVLATLGASATLEPSPLLPGWRVGEPHARVARVGRVSSAHPILRTPGDWRRVRFFKHRRVTPGEDDRVLIEYDDGAPLLIERTLGAGRVLILTAPIDRRWNDLAIHPLFVQFLAEAGRYLTGGEPAPVAHTAGEIVMTGLTAAGGGQIFGPSGERVLNLAQARDADRLTPESPGFYEVRSSAGARWFAVNVDARESDLTPSPADYVERWRALPVREAQRAEHTAGAAAGPRSLGPLLLWIAAALLFLEFLLANRHLAVRRGVRSGDSS